MVESLVFLTSNSLQGYANNLAYLTQSFAFLIAELQDLLLSFGQRGYDVRESVDLIFRYLISIKFKACLLRCDYFEKVDRIFITELFYPRHIKHPF